MIIGLIAVFRISQWALANLAYVQIYARQGCHNSRIWILHARCWNKLCTVMQQRANCLFASQSSILLTALCVYLKHLFSKRSVNFTSSLQLTSSRAHCFFILSQVFVFFLVACVEDGVPAIWEMFQVAGNLRKNQLPLSLTTRYPPVVSITVYLPHTEVLFDLTRTFFSRYLLFRDFWEETKGFQSQTPWSGSWLSASQCGHCFRSIAAQASQECVHEIIRWERSVVEAFRFGTLKDGPQSVFPGKARTLLCVGMSLRVCVMRGMGDGQMTWVSLCT